MATQTQHTSNRTGVVHLALDVANRGQSTALAVLQDARTELRTAVEGGIEYAEKLTTGAFRFARKLVQKVDEASADALNGAERTLANVIKNAHEAADAGRQLATTAVEQGKELASSAVSRVTDRSPAKA